MGEHPNLMRCAAAILRTDRPLSAEFREQVAQMIEALDQCETEMLMVEQAHKDRSQPHYSRGLEMIRAVLDRAKEGNSGKAF